MKKLKDSIIEYFNSFSKSQRRALILFVVIIIIGIVGPSVYTYFFVPQTQKANAFTIATLNELKVYEDTGFNNYENNYPKYNKRNYDNDDYAKYKDSKSYNDDDNDNDNYELFNFDPNTATASDWKRLGVRDKTIETIQKYTSKGGKFYKPDDIDKIFGLRDFEKERLKPYVQISTASTLATSTASTGVTPALPKTVYTPQIIDINIADTSAYIKLPGIGSKLAQRIVAFRDKLGGFVSVNQIAEVYGLPDSTFQKIKLQLQFNTAPKKINLNTATADELKVHPYFKWNLANSIVQYRNQHGNYKTINDLKNIMIIDEATFTKISPYLSL